MYGLFTTHDWIPILSAKWGRLDDDTGVTYHFSEDWNLHTIQSHIDGV